MARITAFVAILTLAFLPACTTTTQSTDTVAIRIATDATFPPFHYIHGGEVTGYDVAVATEAVERIGATPNVVRITNYDKLFDDLLAGEVDMVAATTGITPEREEIYLFSTPYYTTCQAALVRDGEDRPHTVADLEGQRVGAAGAGTSFRAMSGLPAEHVRIRPGEDGVAMLRAGDIDALIIDEYEVVALAAEHDDLTVIPEPVALERYAIVMAPGSTHLKKQLDKAIADMARDGTLARLQEQFNLNRPVDWPVDIR